MGPEVLVGPLDLLPAVADEAVRPVVVKVVWNPGVFRQFLLLLALTGTYWHPARYSILVTAIGEVF